MDHSGALLALRVELRQTILLLATSAFIFVVLAAVPGYGAFSGKDLGDISPLIALGQFVWNGGALVALDPGGVRASSSSLHVPANPWSTAPFVLFLSFWSSFAAERYIGIISRPVEWYVNRTVPMEWRGASPAGGQSQRGSSDPEVVPLTEVIWEGRDEEEFELPPEYDQEEYDQPEYDQQEYYQQETDVPKTHNPATQ
ncbi:hypothetical protein PG993_010897 [Apiospora rasikravindrae]|uniref:Uncharacterized protein n=1 Tax=Apiospora rasikravindrae TaxID=990691 RepID=A0ABR1SCL9_9PEZI